MAILKKFWKDFGFTPNPAQEKAIRHLSGPLYLPAGPGSGKTRVLLWRTLNQIAMQGHNPDEIFLATFTEKAAAQLREGIRVLLGAVSNVTKQPYDLERMYVGTVHSLCQRIIKDRRFYEGRRAARAPQVLDDLEQYFTIYRRSRWEALTAGLMLGEEPTKEINQLFETRGSSRFEAANNCIGLFNRLSEECLGPDDWRGVDLDPLLKELLVAYERYRANLLTAPVQTDFSLLQQEALRVVQNYKGEPLFKHVIVDEYQDTNTIQERLYFALAAQTQNLCVVGDDDQALYRFRGATVENFVQFPKRCREAWGIEPTKIPLATNYRSRKQIVDFYTGFMDWADWSEHGNKGGRVGASPGDYYRVPDKGIHPHSKDDAASVVLTPQGNGVATAYELAAICKRLLDAGTVSNPNQIAFLFPSLKGVQVGRIRDELAKLNLKVYAPRAGRFLEVEEAVAVLGLYLQVFGKPTPSFTPTEKSDYGDFLNWMNDTQKVGAELMKADPELRGFIGDMQADVKRVQDDYDKLIALVEKSGWDLKAPYDMNTMKRPLASVAGLSDTAKKTLVSLYFDRIVQQRITDGDPLSLSYVIQRATSLDWNPLDLFYRLCGFSHFKAMFDLAETGGDEGPICNLGLVSQYLARFMEEYASLLTASFLKDDRFQLTLFSSYLYALFRRGESEYEDAHDPFPRGRIPFLTIHQSKGLEFPVVVLGSVSRTDRGPQAVEKLVTPLLSRQGEPLDRMSEFDSMRLFYVALSRAQNLLVLPDTRGPGVSPFAAFKPLIASGLTRTDALDLATVPKAEIDDDETPRHYSFTSDYQLYERCPRQYMIFRKYGFVPSRTQTMMFGSLVHQTIEDLHQFLIAQKKAGTS